MKSILFAVIAAFCFGLGTPFARVAFNKGMNADGLTLSYAVALFVIGSITLGQTGFKAMFPNNQTLIFGLIAGTMCAFGLKASAITMSLPSSLMSVVVLIIATYPVVSSATCIPLFNEWERVTLPKFIMGTVLVVSGIFFVATSIKPVVKVTAHTQPDVLTEAQK